MTWNKEAVSAAAEYLKTTKSVNVKGKDYVLVNDRVMAFRNACPGGAITTEIVPELSGDGIVTMRTTVTDETGQIIATGFAQEKESSSYINKTSYIENCETSAIGRALGMCGIGIETSVAAAEELANAITNQNKESSHHKIVEYCYEKKLDPKELNKEFGLAACKTEKEFAAKLKEIKAKYD